MKFFDNSYFLFWFPHKVVVPYDGKFYFSNKKVKNSFKIKLGEIYPTIPLPTKGEVAAQKGYSRNFYSGDDYYNTLSNFVLELKNDEPYKNRPLKFNDSIFVIK